MRQAQESEIIRLSMDVRDRKLIKPFKGQEVNIIKRKDLIDGMLTWADQVLCGRNNTRHGLNEFFRRRQWGENYSIEPKLGDKIICLHNDWNTATESGEALVNGTIGTIESITTIPDRWLGQKCYIDFAPEESESLYDFFTGLLVDWKLITTHEPTITKENFRFFRKINLQQFDYGYAITVWKAQGSEYKKVTFIAERVGPMDSEKYAKYLYTGITRASEKLTLVMP